MKKDELLKSMQIIADSYFQKKDFISAGQINRAIDVVNDYDGDLEKELESENKDKEKKIN